MRNNRKTKIILGVTQQILALILAFITSLLLVHSDIIVNNMYGEKVKYVLSPFDTAGDYTNSVIFNQLLQNAINDVETFAVIKGQIETGGKVDLEKKINVTEFVNRKNPQSPVSQCPVTAVYELGDLIKWGRYGMETQSVNFQSKFDFLTYFGYENLVTSIDDYGAYEEYGIIPPVESSLDDTTEDFRERELGDDSDFDGLEEQVAYEKIRKYIQQVGGEDAVYQAIVSKLAQMDVVVTEIDRSGQTIIQVNMLDNRYEMIDGAPFRNHCRNWEEYYMLEKNVVETIETIGINYAQYQKQNSNYKAEKTNLLFYVEAVSNEGEHMVYTNMPKEFLNLYSGEKLKYLEDRGKYLYYSPKDMDFKTNTRITEKEMIRKLDSYNYALSEDTKIWIGIDGSFPVSTDIFSLVRDEYNQMISNVWLIMIICSLCGIGWIIIFFYISCYTGKRISKDGKKTEYYTHILDHIPLELLLAVVVVVSITVVKGFGTIRAQIEENSFNKYEYRQLMEVFLTERYLTLLITVCGFGICLFMTVVWYSVIRRWHSKVLWEGSALQRITDSILQMLRQLFYGGNVLVQTIMPYNIFILFNFLTILWLHDQVEKKSTLFYFMIALMVLIDVAVGWWIFLKSMERREILKGAEKIGQGDIDYEIKTSNLHGENIALGEAVNNMGEGIRKSVAKSLKDERMKTDLITNVSHDIKTPLTSIINYVNLLKREKIETEPIKEYIQILDAKSQRLKQLTDDLVEASKISSGNIVLNKEKLDLKELLRQSLGEFSEKFESKNLIPVFDSQGEHTEIYADSRRMWRVIENLLNNVFKYSMPSTRVYISVIAQEGRVRTEIKNISENPLNIKAEELTERFIRGDVSRSTEGSGLGLSIVKGLVDVQGGEFKLELDGDLFKSSIIFEQYEEKKVEEMKSEENKQKENADK